MKRNYLLVLGAAFILFTSCGPKRFSCGGRRRCISMEQDIKTKQQDKTKATYEVSNKKPSA